MTAVINPACPRPETGLAKSTGFDQPDHPLPVPAPGQREYTAPLHGSSDALAVAELAARSRPLLVITENAASDNQGVPRKEILGDMSGITFDESERIDIVHDELVKAYESGDIFAVRR